MKDWLKKKKTEVKICDEGTKHKTAVAVDSKIPSVFFFSFFDIARSYSSVLIIFGDAFV